MNQKVDPYLRPLFDALHEHMGGAEKVQKAMERQQIEIAPLAYMRGRTLQQAFIILDEAQNTTPEQMKMFLTRLGWGSRMVITGDLTQIDLPRHQRSGLLDAQLILSDVAGIAFCGFSGADVVRHPLVQKIIVLEGVGIQKKYKTDHYHRQSMGVVRRVFVQVYRSLFLRFLRLSQRSFCCICTLNFLSKFLCFQFNKVEK
jgi:phosphate starvation-inducible protein PhoH